MNADTLSGFAQIQTRRSPRLALLKLLALASALFFAHAAGATTGALNQSLDELFPQPFSESEPSACCQINAVAGCGDSSCETQVCAVDPDCCTVFWGGSCAILAQELCDACADIPKFSVTDPTGQATGPDNLDTPALEDLVVLLLGTGVDLVAGSVTFTGDERAAGWFSGGGEIVGLDSGIILSSGQAIDLVGPNTSPDQTTDFGTPGDDALSTLAGQQTFDAAILEFEFEANADQVFFRYVFGSEEYNEYVYSVNDVFAFWINGENCALTPDGLPVAINTINNGQPGAPPTNPELYVNNDPFNMDFTETVVPLIDLANTQMDGFTVVLTCEAEVQEGSNTIRLAIADSTDEVLDSWVLIEADSLSTTPPGEPDPEPQGVCVDLIADGGDNPTVVGQVCAEQDETHLLVSYFTEHDWTLVETHLAVSSDLPGTGEWIERRWTNRNGNPAPGQFPYSSAHEPGEVTLVLHQVPLADLDGNVGDLVYLGAHAVVVEQPEVEGDPVRVESAWGDGERFVLQGNWATWFSYELQ